MSATTFQQAVTTFTVGRPVRDPNYISLYANQLRVGASINDFSITFSIMEDVAGSHSLVDKATVQMSPISFKALVLNINMILEQYESVVGTIPQSEAAVEAIKKIAPQVRANYETQLGKKAAS